MVELSHRQQRPCKAALPQRLLEESPMQKQYTVRKPIMVIGPSIAYIPLTRGLFCIVEVEDAARLCQWNWFATSSGRGRTRKFYACRWIVVDGRRRLIKMHRDVIGCTARTCDHANGNSQDNRSHNLRGASHAQNRYNSICGSNSKSGIKGISQLKSGRWHVRLRVARVIVYLGTYDALEEAKTAYATGIAKYAGKFARAA